MLRREFTLINKLGLHARASAKFVQCANAFNARLTVCKGERTVDGKSMMGLMMLAASCGSQIQCHAEGEDGNAMLDALEMLIADYFEEGG